MSLPHSWQQPGSSQVIEPQGTARSGLVLHGTGGTLRSTLQWRCHLTFSLPFIGIATTSLQASSRHRRVRLGACDVDVVRVSAESMSSEPECPILILYYSMATAGAAAGGARRAPKLPYRQSARVCAHDSRNNPIPGYAE